MYNDEDITKYIIAAYREAQKSPDNSTQVGVILVNPEGIIIGRGHNRPVGFEASETTKDREFKYRVTIHGEIASICDAARHGHPTHGATMIGNYVCCSKCATAAVESGITTIIRDSRNCDKMPDRWRDEVLLGDEILQKSGIAIIDYDAANLGIGYVIFDGELWKP